MTSAMKGGKMKIYSKDELALEVFNGLAEKMTGHKIPRAVDTVPGEDLIILGGEEINTIFADGYLNGKRPLSAFRSGSDDYFIESHEAEGRHILLLGGGRRRALLYAVYAYFELIGCGYFWDGDVIPKRDALQLDGFHVTESPRFEYRGLRYFAHRSLHRFQAEHWTLDDWKKEIDWILKKRLNLFMLRTGQDDLFQKAFPDIVAYPEDSKRSYSEEELKVFHRSFHDRRPVWSLRERGRLRKALLEYAFERDLMHPEDTGTMTHWYSSTPQEFLDAEKPDFIPVANSLKGYAGSPKNLVWDIRSDKNIENYFKLTQAHIDHYGRGELFHTIGLAERRVSDDSETNHRWKLYAYRRIIERLRKSYPNAPLLLASWDFLNRNWTSDELRELLSMMDPRNTLLFDYTSDTDIENNNFLYWQCVGKFPWIFGIFQAFESGNDLRGNYETIKRRLMIAKNDPYCKGMVIWPENSHGDTLMYEFFAANAWKPDFMEIRDFIPVFCRRRYGEAAARMERLWKAFLPVIECGYWNFHQYYGEMFAHLEVAKFPVDAKEADSYLLEIKRLAPCANPAVEALADLADCPLDDPMIRRDVIDMARTAGGRLFQYLYNKTAFLSIAKADLTQILDLSRCVLHTLADIVRSSAEFSLCYSLDDLKSYASLASDFETTLKNNAVTDYNRTYIAELFDGCYFDEFETYADGALKGVDKVKDLDEIREKFMREPLEQYRPDCAKYLANLPDSIRTLSSLAKEVSSLED